MKNVLTGGLLRTEHIRDVMLVLLWGTFIAFFFAQALFQRARITIYDIGILFAICLAAGAIIQDYSKVIVGYIGAMLTGMTILFALTTIPVMTGAVAPPEDQFLMTFWISIIIQQMPVSFFLGAIGSVMGAGLAEYFWY
jgi:hypothetical protein